MIELPPWLTGPMERARNLMELGRLPHALLIQGPGGWGELLLANRLAMALIDREGDASELAHPDLRWVEPDEGVTKVDQIRAVIEFLQQTAQVSPNKVVVIVEAHRMNLSAANALLKILEEPPSGSHLLLVTSAPERLLPTIQSRCQRLAVEPVPEADVRAWLAEAGLDEAGLDTLLIEYGGAPFDVLAAIEAEKPPIWGLLSGVRDRPAILVEVAEKLKNEDLVDVLARWSRYVHRLVVDGRAGSDTAAFYDELVAVRRIALVNTGLNKQQQLERLLLLWKDLELTL